MTLLKCTIRRILFAMTIFVLAGEALTANGKLTLTGQVFDSDGDKVKKAELTLRKGGDVVEEDRTKGNGKFKFHHVEPYKPSTILFIYKSIYVQKWKSSRLYKLFL